jgi:preprotein translocase subunit SecD
MGKVKKVYTNVRILILVAAIIMAVVAINPNPWNDGVTIRSVAKNSSAQLAGIMAPSPTSTPMSKERILAMNNVPVHNEQDYYSIISALEPGMKVVIKTNKALYSLEVKNETGLGLKVYNAPKTNIKKGLDLQGGTRVLLKPEERLSSQDFSMLTNNMKERLNIFGLSDVVVREATDLSGNHYVLVEIAGANEEEVQELLARQGKFEAKVLNNTVFKGGRKDITYVCRAADCSGLDPAVGCWQAGSNWFCRFRFTISLSQAAAEAQAAATKNLAVTTQDGDNFLNETLDLYLDDVLVDALNIGADLKGKAVTDIQISGTGSGFTQQEATSNALKNMYRLQTIMITGHLPSKLQIIQSDTISPILGQQFVRNAFIVAAIAILVVTLMLLGIYRRFKVALPIMLTSLLEILILLGVAAMVGRDIDLAAIAGIIAVVGTGVDQQVVITDEVLRGETRRAFTWKEKFRNAFFIIMGAYITLIVAMFPLLNAGAGLLRGFALMAMIGATIGVFITRPAFAQIIEILMRE